MKKTLSIAFCVLIMCSLLVVGIVKAGNSAFAITEYVAVAPCTPDGKWTTSDEWNDAPNVAMTGNTSGGFAYDIQDFTNLGIEWLVEILNDGTNNAGDYFQICLDADNSGGTAPQVGDFMIQITGHTNNLTLYQGTGSGWAVNAPAAGEFSWASTLNTSRWSSTPHWILEIVDSGKTAGTLQTPQPPNGMRIAAFDAATNLLASWPPNSSANVPNQYGVIDGYSMDPVPEGFSLGVIVLLSSVAMMVGFYYSRKRPKITNLTPTTL